ncbi:hypothetical protein SAMN05660209_04774 [Geodermatophilus africanus]|uniref:Uncharacterized protein n=1 Tax=Geodermatophilus africanus TaxID=1137993 RepID=A0A1H3QJE3_9ACTN|nr:hypothetical protein [Geodermatophilus africanus]SDZ13221.1 hypothetical protein SAMN05660209_04774 [Geodermatophilus africanus]
MTTKDSLTNLAVDVPFIPVKARNTLLDSLFYDVGSLSGEEQAQLSPLTDREGAIVVVPPSGRGPLRHYRNAARYVNAEGDRIRALAVAGVGSSVIGTAAFARNVADAIGSDVAGVVTGYGFTDLITEALGGWFFFGALDRARMRFERLVETSRSALGSALPAALGGRDIEPVRQLRGAPGFDVETVVDILKARPEELVLLVGHSKGSLLLDYVLEQFVCELDGDDHELYDRLHVVTFGAVVDVPDQFKHVHQFLGSLDWFGGLNSRRSTPRSPVPGAWHHLNRRLPYHLDAVQALQEYMADGVVVRFDEQRDRAAAAGAQPNA